MGKFIVVSGGSTVPLLQEESRKMVNEYSMLPSDKQERVNEWSSLRSNGERRASYLPDSCTR